MRPILLNEKEIESYREKGFLLLKRFISPGDIAVLNLEVRRLFTVALDYYGIEEKDFETALYRLFQEFPDGFKNCGKHVQHLFSLWRMCCDPSFSTVMRDLGLKFPNICKRPVLFFNSKHLAKEDIYHTVPAHQDWASMEGSLDSVVVWVPLCDVAKELGALQVVPESHKHGLLADEYQNGFGIVNRYSDKDFISVETDHGDALIFSSFLVHRSGKNTTDKIRWSCHFRYNNMLHPEYGKRDFIQPYTYVPHSKSK